MLIASVFFVWCTLISQIKRTHYGSRLTRSTRDCRCQNRFGHLYETILLENLFRHCRELPAGSSRRDKDQAFHLKEQNKTKNSQLHDLILFTDGLHRLTVLRITINDTHATHKILNCFYLFIVFGVK